MVPRLIVVIAVCCGTVSAAALVAVPGPKGSLPIAGLEANRGQAKPDILFLSRANSSLAVTARSVLYSPFGVRMTFVASNPNPVLRFLDPLPGIANSFTGADPRKWVTGIPRYGTAHLAGIYPGIDVQYVIDAAGNLTLKLLCQPGSDPKAVVFDFPEAVNVERLVGGYLRARLGLSKLDPVLDYEQPFAFQERPSGRISRNVDFQVQSTTRFGFQVEEYDTALPLQIELKLTRSANPPLKDVRHGDSAGNTFIAATIADAAGKDAPFPTYRWAGCGIGIEWPIACSDVAVYKFSKNGELIFVSYLEGRTREEVSFAGLAPDGALILTGSTDSADFPVTAAALQPVYGGPAATVPGYNSSSVAGDFFAIRLDPASGALRAATYLGGPNADSVGQTALGADGSVYFMPKWLVRSSAGMPVTRGALQQECAGNPCSSSFAARVSPALDRLLYGTYLPGRVHATAKLHSDGSVYYAGDADAGFPTTPGAYQRQPAGKEDGIVARLDPSGSRLLFATYLGGPNTDWILRMAVAPDGSVWTAVTSFVDCCIKVEHRLVRMDANGQRILAETRIDVGDLVVDRDGNLTATAFGNFTVGPDAFLANACAGFYVAYLKLSPSGQQLFATYLPTGGQYDFVGTSDRGSPILLIDGGRFEVVENRSMGVYTGCVVDAASFSNFNALSPGAIVTLFGSSMGPREGVQFQLKDERLPTALGGTRVLVNGEPVPILYASYWQVNAILPYSLLVGSQPKIQVESNGNVGNELGGFYVQGANISLFSSDDSPSHPAAALNEDGTVNSPRNPAKKGSSVMLFGTGGGTTVPPSVAGDVTPLELRQLDHRVRVRIQSQDVKVEYAGAAPGLVAGVTQINIKLPDVIPDVAGLPRGVVPLSVDTSASGSYTGYATIAVTVD